MIVFDFRPALAGYVYCYQLPSVYFVLNEKINEKTSQMGASPSVTIIKTNPFNINNLDGITSSGLVEVIYLRDPA